MVVTEVRDSIYLTDMMVRATGEQRASLQTPEKSSSGAGQWPDDPFEPSCNCSIHIGTAGNLAA
jgi:hypothetical protein